jgi:hypothetical protein
MSVYEMTKTQWYKLVEDWEKSGLSKAEFCTQINLCRSQFYYWQKKKSQELTLQSTEGVSIQLGQVFSPVDLGNLSIPASNQQPKPFIEISLPHGIILKIPMTSC